MAITFSNCEFATKYLVNEVCYRKDKTSLPKKITIHITAGINSSLSGLRDWMNSACATAAEEEKNNPGKGSDKWASANYCIDSDGNIGLMIEEKYRALTSANNANDRQAVTIEVVNCAGEPDWPVSDKAFEALIKLCVDICKRNNIKKLNYTGDASGNLTRHDFFIERTCPGPYLGAKFPEIASRVNDILELNGDGLIYEPRLSLTESEAKSLKYYNSENPFGAVGTGLTGGFGLPNCTAYAWGRWYELFDKYNKGTKPEYLSLGNAEDWYPHNQNLSSNKQYPYGSEPKLGSIVCYNDPVEDKGHVAIVEKITKKDNGVIEIETSNSGYGNSSFFYPDTGSSSGKWCSKTRDRYEFQGFIYLPFTFQERLGGTPPKDTDVYIWNFLYAYIRKPAVVAGIMGNLYQESLLRSHNLQETGNTYYNMSDETFTARIDNGFITKDAFSNDGFGYGLAQWTSPPSFKRDLYNFKNNPKSFYMEFDANTKEKRETTLSSGEHLKPCSIGDIDMQMNYLVRWLWQGGNNIIGDLNETSSDWWKSLLQKTTPNEAAEYFCNYIEQPNKEHANMENRKYQANRFYNKFTSLDMSNDFNDFGVYNWMCGLAEDYTPPSTYVEPRCKKCHLPISKCKCYFLKYENSIVEEYNQPYSEKTNPLYSPKGVLLYYTDKKIEECLYNTGEKLPNTLIEPSMNNKPYDIPFHFMIGKGKYEDKETYKTIQTFNPKKVLNKSGTGKWGTLEAEYIHVLICAGLENNTEVTQSETSNPKDIMRFIRYCVSLKLKASNTVPPDTQTDILTAGDESLYGTDEGKFINEVCEGIAFIYKNYINEEYLLVENPTLKNDMEMLSLLSINEAYQYQLAKNDKTFFFPLSFGYTTYNQDYDSEQSSHSLYYKIDYNQWFSEPVQTKDLVLSSIEDLTDKPIGIYNMYEQVVNKGSENLEIPPYVEITELNEAQWADGVQLKEEELGSYQKALPVTSDVQDGYFIIGPKLEKDEDDNLILQNIDAVPKSSFIKGTTIEQINPEDNEE